VYDISVWIEAASLKSITSPVLNLRMHWLVGQSHSRIFGGTHPAPIPTSQAVSCFERDSRVNPGLPLGGPLARNAGLRDRWPPFRDLCSYLDPYCETAVFLGQLVRGFESVEIIHRLSRLFIVREIAGVFHNSAVSPDDFPIVNIPPGKNSPHRKPLNLDQERRPSPYSEIGGLAGRRSGHYLYPLARENYAQGPREIEPWD